jgi:hypothetical protein
VDAPVTAEMVAELRGGGKDFGSEIGDQRAEVREQRAEKKHGEVENPEAHNDTTKKAVVS